MRALHHQSGTQLAFIRPLAHQRSSSLNEVAVLQSCDSFSIGKAHPREHVQPQLTVYKVKKLARGNLQTLQRLPRNRQRWGVVFVISRYGANPCIYFKFYCRCLRKVLASKVCHVFVLQMLQNLLGTLPCLYICYTISPYLHYSQAWTTWKPRPKLNNCRNCRQVLLYTPCWQTLFVFSTTSFGRPCKLKQQDYPAWSRWGICNEPCFL